MSDNRSNPPIDLAVLEERIYSALEDIGSEKFLSLLARLGGEMPSYLKAHLELEHSLPSPSGLTSCRTQLYWKGKKAEEDEGKRIPAHWFSRSAAGVMKEPFWFAVLERAGLELTITKEPKPCGPHMRAHPDAYIGDTGLLELKDLTAWTFKHLIEGQGIAYEEPRYYTQCQMYMEATGRDWTLFFASTPDPAFAQSIFRREKKYGQQWTIPLAYMEIVYRRQQDVDAGLMRAEMIVRDAAADFPPPPEFDGKVKWPCSYCGYQARCQEAFN